MRWTPTDSRARIVRLTERGQRLERTIYAEAEAAQQRIGELLGPRRFDQLRHTLEQLVELVSAADSTGDREPRGTRH